MMANIKFSIIATCIALVILVTHINHLEAANLQASPALQTIFNQAEATYIKPFFSDITINSALNQSPESFAVNIGLTMQRQFKYLRSNPAYVSRFEVLREEALAFMGQLAKAHNYRNPTDKSDLPAMRLRSAFYAGLNGELNAMLINKYGLDPANVGLPFMLSQVPAPKNTGGDGVTPHGKLYVKKKNEINLLGQKAPAALDKSGNETPVAADHPSPTGQCPKQSSERSFYIDSGTNQRVKSSTASCTYCFYENGMLLSETPYVNGKKHGVEKWFRIDNGPYYMSQSTPYTNDKKDGIEESYRYDSKSGRVYLSERKPYKSAQIHGTRKHYKMKKGTHILIDSTPYVNDKKHGVRDDYRWANVDGQDKYFLAIRTVYVQGKRVESIDYDYKGNIRSRKTY